jgi:hypothetical protein
MAAAVDAVRAETGRLEYIRLGRGDGRMSQVERQRGLRGQVKAAVQEFSRAAAAKAVSAGAHSGTAGVCDQLGTEARELTSGHRLHEVGLRRKRLAEPRSEVREAVDKEATLVQRPGKGLDLLRPGRQRARLGPIPREGGCELGGKRSESLGVKKGQAAQAVADHLEQSGGARPPGSSALAEKGGSCAVCPVRRRSVFEL